MRPSGLLLRAASPSQRRTFITCLPRHHEETATETAAKRAESSTFRNTPAMNGGSKRRDDGECLVNRTDLEAVRGTCD